MLTSGYGFRRTCQTPCTGLRIRRPSLRLAGGRVVAWLRSGDGLLSVRARPSSIKRDCDRRARSTGEKRLVNVHAKSRLTPEPLGTLRPETKGHAGACPYRTRAIPAQSGRSRGSLHQAHALRARSRRVPQMSPNRHQQPTVATSSNL
jgi:hypothetical protein